tara:strand:- start:933 stop:1214 length:282 start_codon:yes stop_codon:yes gene_type:complete
LSSTQLKSHTKEYLIIFAVLALLTVLELFVPEMDVAYYKKAISLTLLALAKAFCVAYYYMHLNEESKWLKFIAAIPISAFIYFLVLVLEASYR